LPICVRSGFIGDLYEKDFGSVRIGTPATVTGPSGGPECPARPASPTLIPGRPATRRQKVRVEVPNPDRSCASACYVTVSFERGGTARESSSRHKGA